VTASAQTTSLPRQRSGCSDATRVASRSTGEGAVEAIRPRSSSRKSGAGWGECRRSAWRGSLDCAAAQGTSPTQQHQRRPQLFRARRLNSGQCIESAAIPLKQTSLQRPNSLRLPSRACRSYRKGRAAIEILTSRPVPPVSKPVPSTAARDRPAERQCRRQQKHLTAKESSSPLFAWIISGHAAGDPGGGRFDHPRQYTGRTGNRS